MLDFNYGETDYNDYSEKERGIRTEHIAYGYKRLFYQGTGDSIQLNGEDLFSISRIVTINDYRPVLETGLHSGEEAEDLVSLIWDLYDAEQQYTFARQEGRNQIIRGSGELAISGSLAVAGLVTSPTGVGAVFFWGGTLAVGSVGVAEINLGYQKMQHAYDVYENSSGPVRRHSAWNNSIAVDRWTE